MTSEQHHRSDPPVALLLQHSRRWVQRPPLEQVVPGISCIGCDPEIKKILPELLAPKIHHFSYNSAIKKPPLMSVSTRTPVYLVDLPYILLLSIYKTADYWELFYCWWSTHPTNPLPQQSYRLHHTSTFWTFCGGIWQNLSYSHSASCKEAWDFNFLGF